MCLAYVPSNCATVLHCILCNQCKMWGHANHTPRWDAIGWPLLVPGGRGLCVCRSPGYGSLMPSGIGPGRSERTTVGWERVYFMSMVEGFSPPDLKGQGLNSVLLASEDGDQGNECRPHTKGHIHIKLKLEHFLVV